MSDETTTDMASPASTDKHLKPEGPDLSEPAILTTHKDGADSSPSSEAATAQPINDDQPPEALPVGATRYSVWSKQKKHWIVLSAAFGAVFSTLTTNMYLPALQVLSDDFNVSTSQINLTITLYLVFQGLTPMFIGGLADHLGRRPAYIYCFVVYIGANIGLALAPNYATLLGVRVLQAAGIAATQSLCQAVVADIITSAERGQYIGFVTLSAILGPSIGPLIGGGLTDGLGWRSIFWFLVIAASINLLLIIFFFPETCRQIVGDGSIRPPKTHETWWRLLKKGLETEVKDKKDTLGSKHLLSSLTLILYAKELSLLLLYGGVVYSGIQAISAAVPTQFASIYGFNSLEIGLMFLPMAAGSVVAALVAGKALNWNYRRHAEKLGLVVDRNAQIDLLDFQIERARFEIALPMLGVTAIVIIGWGWALDRHTSIGVIAVLAFIIGASYICVLNVFNALITDLYRKKAGAAVAANWLVRCAFAAGMTAAIEPMIVAVGSGWAYTIIGLSYVVFSPILLLIMWRGMKWRQDAQAKEDALTRKTEAQRADAEKGMQEKDAEKQGEKQV